MESLVKVAVVSIAVMMKEIFAISSDIWMSFDFDCLLLNDRQIYVCSCEQLGTEQHTTGVCLTVVLMHARVWLEMIVCALEVIVCVLLL